MIAAVPARRNYTIVASTCGYELRLVYADLPLGWEVVDTNYELSSGGYASIMTGDERAARDVFTDIAVHGPPRWRR